MSLFLSMAAFALAMSISPGPVNIVALSAGARYGVRASMRHVSGATIGFTVLLIVVGLGLHEVLVRWQWLTLGIQLGGVAFLLYMAYNLARDDGGMPTADSSKGPSFFHGAAMQWLNPKAWLATVAGMGAFVASGDVWLLLQFALIYFVICYLSVGSWAVAGGFLRRHLSEPRKMRLFNRSMAALLAASAFYLLWTA